MFRPQVPSTASKSKGYFYYSSEYGPVHSIFLSVYSDYTPGNQPTLQLSLVASLICLMDYFLHCAFPSCSGIRQSLLTYRIRSVELAVHGFAERQQDPDTLDHG